MNDIDNAILEEVKQWAAEVTPKVNAAKRTYDIHHNRVQSPIMSRLKYKLLSDGRVKISLMTSKFEIFTSKGIGKNPQNRLQKPWMEPLFESVEDLGNRCAGRVSDEITKFLKW